MTETILKRLPSHVFTTSTCLYVRKLEIVIDASDKCPFPLPIPTL